MSRSVCAFAIINPNNYEYYINTIISNYNFKLRTENDENVWVSESEDNDVIQYIKITFSESSLVISSWVRFKSDENKYREYCTEKFENEPQKIRNIMDVISELYKTYGSAVQKKTLWVLR